MLMQHDARQKDFPPFTALYEVEAELLGARRRPVVLALGSLASALLVLATCPLTSFLAFSTIFFFLGSAVFFVLVADGELARRGAEDFAAVGDGPRRS